MTLEPGRPSTFPGFPSGARATAIPSVFFSKLLPEISDEAELRVTLYALYALGRRKGYPRFVTVNELACEAPLLASLAITGAEPRQALRRGLELALSRGSLLRLGMEDEGRNEELLFLNSASDRRAVQRLREGAIGLGRPVPPAQAAPSSKRESIFQIYEENIGPLTPLVAEELHEAEQLYPLAWVHEALREAALLNKRSWRYASRILQRWATEGRRREEAGRDPGEGDSARAQLLRRYRDLRRG